MRRTRIEKQRRPVRVRRYPDKPYGTPDDRDPRDPDVVRAKRLRSTQNGGTDRLQNRTDTSPSDRTARGVRDVTWFRLPHLD